MASIIGIEGAIMEMHALDDDYAPVQEKCRKARHGDVMCMNCGLVYPHAGKP